MPGALRALSLLILTTAPDVGVTIPILQTGKQRLRENRGLARRSPLLLSAAPGERWDLREDHKQREREMQTSLPGFISARAHRPERCGPPFPSCAHTGREHWPHTSCMLLLSPNSLPGWTVQGAGFRPSPPMISWKGRSLVTPPVPDPKSRVVPLGTCLRGAS